MMDVAALRRSVLPTMVAAVLGNAFIGRDSLQWFQDLKRPRMQVSLPTSMAIGGMYYASLGTVLYRCATRSDHTSYRLGLSVLAANELWNVVLFGRRNPRGAFFGILGFTVPVVALQWSVKDDRVATLALVPYTAWVIGYDIPWSYLLWRRNPTG